MSQDEPNHNEKLADIGLEVHESQPCDWDELTAFADRNGISIPIYTYIETQQDVPEGLIERAVETQKEHRRYLTELLELDALFENEVEYVAIKSRMLHDIQPWDLNILVAATDWERATELLDENGWYRAGLIEHPLARTEPGKYLYKHKKKFPVHLHRHVSWNGVIYIPAETVLSARVRSNGVYYPSWKIDTLIHCAHSVFENYELTLAEAYQITHILDNDAMRKIAQVNGWENGYDIAVSTAKEIMHEIKNGSRPELPKPYSKSSLIQAWSENTKTNGIHQLPVHLALYLLK